MARKMVKFLACDRCPVGKEQPATRVETISIGDSRWEMDLCEDCGRRLDRDIYGWGRLGRPIEARGSSEGQRLIANEYLYEAKRAAELRSKQVGEDRARPPKDTTVVTRIDPERVLPPHAADWSFTQHAQEKLMERKIRVVDALRAACVPTIVHEGKDPGTAVHEYKGVRVAVESDTKRILTVSFSDDRKAK